MRVPYEAVVRVRLAFVSCRVAPVTMATLVPRLADHRKLPPLAASKKLTLTIVSALPAHEAHAGTFDKLRTPPEAAENVAAGRVVTLEMFDVPAEPGAPTWSCTKTADGAV
jgi:hypothetical protein